MQPDNTFRIALMMVGRKLFGEGTSKLMNMRVLKYKLF